MINYMFEYTGKYIKHHFKKIIPDIICIFLCICCTTVLAVIGGSYINTVNNYDMLKTGKQEVIYCNVSIEDIADIAGQPAVKESGITEVFGIQAVTDSAYEGDIIFGTVDAGAQALTCMKLTDGNFPQNDNEITLEENILYKIKKKIGDTYVFNITALNSDKVLKKEYKIAGTVADYSFSQSAGDSSVNLLPNAILKNGALSADFSDGESGINILLSFHKNKKPENFNDFYKSSTGKNAADFFAAGAAAGKNAFGDSFDEAFSTVSVKYIFIILVCMCVLVIIFGLLLNVLITRTRNNSDIKMLKSAGCANSDIKLFFVLRTCICFCIALPPSVAVSCAVISLFKKAVADFWDIFSVHTDVFLIGSLLAFMCLLSVLFQLIGTNSVIKKMPIEIDERDDTYNFAQNKTMKTKSAVLNLTVKSFSRDRRRIGLYYVLTTVCVVLLIAGSILSNTLIRDLESKYAFDYRMYGADMSFMTELEIPTKLNVGISGQDIELIKDACETDFVFAVKTVPMKLVTNDKSKFSKDSYFPEETADGIANIKQRCGYNRDEYLVYSGIDCYDDDILNMLKKYVIAGEINTEKLRKGTDIILLTRNSKSIDRLNEECTFSQLICNDNFITSGNPEDVNRYDLKLNICAVVDISKIEDARLHEFVCSTSGYVTSNDALKDYPVPINYSDIYIVLNSDENTEKLDNVFMQMKSVYPNAAITSTRAENKCLSTLVAVTEIVLNSVNIIIAYFAFISIYNMIRKKINTQAKTFAVLRSIGFGMMKTVFVQYAEFIFLSFSSFISGVALTVPLQLFCNKTSLMTTYPWIRAFSSLAILLIVSYIIVLISVKPVYKKNITDLLRD